MSSPQPEIEIVAVAGAAAVQDLGRPGAMHHGVARGGALVPQTHADANRRVGNPVDAATLECFGRIVIRAQGAPATIATHDATVHLALGESLVCEPSREHRVQYVAVRGGLDVPRVLGGRGTLVSAGIGGFRGRWLRAGDRLALGPSVHAPPTAPQPTHRVDCDDLAAPIRVVPGPDLDAFDPSALEVLTRERFTVSSHSDRVGYRLAGATLARRDADHRASAPMACGAIQVPASGVAIVLGPDHPTTGGYPVIACVVRGDLGCLFARRPGAAVQFVAYTACHESEDSLDRLVHRSRAGVDVRRRRSR